MVMKRRKQALLMKMRKLNRSGFSLLELLITIGISGVLATAVGMILVSAHVSWVKSSKEVAISDDLRYIQKKIGYQLRGATTNRIGIYNGGQRLVFVTPQGTNTIRLLNKTVVYTIGGIDETIARDVQSFMVSFAGSGPIVGSAPFFGGSNPYTRAVRFDIIVTTTTNIGTSASTTRADSFIIKTRN
jgi:prepilin-type N-terminal cleavage/methylation domain-containing protein